MSRRNSPSRIGMVVAVGCASAFFLFSVSPASAQLTWTGTISNAWDINTTPNWTDSLTLSQTLAYTDGSAVIFDNTAGTSGNTAVNVVSTVQPASVTFNNSIVPYSFSGAAISGTGSVLLSSSAGSVTFNSPNSYTGGTIVNGGTLTVGDDNAINGVSGGPLSVAAAGMVNFSSPTPTVNGLNGAGGVVLGSGLGGATNLTVNSTSNATFSGTISEATAGAGSLTKTGPNTLTLAGNNSYSGGTTINQGAIAAASLGTGPVTLNNGTRLSLTQGAQAINGFGGMSINNGAGAAATLSGGTLTLTNDTGGQANSAFTTTTVPITNAAGFTASFVYTMTNNNGGAPADGFTFCIQNTGPTAVGAGGGDLAYNAINNSGAACFCVYAGNNPGGGLGSSTQFGYDYSGGNSLPNFGGNGGTPGYLSTSPVDMTSGHPILVNLTYNGLAGTLTEQLTDETTKGTFSYSFSNVNFQTLLGGQAGYVGFTGATGGAYSTQAVSNFNFIGSQVGGQYPSIVVAAGAAAELNFAAPVGNQPVVNGVTLNSGATLNVTSSGAANSAYQITAGTTALVGNATIAVANNGSGLGTFVPGAISGGGNLAVAGPGTVLLSSSLSSYTGATVINGGNLAVTNPASVGFTSGVTINGGVLEVVTGFTDVAPITFAGGALQIDAGQTYSNTTPFAVANGSAVTKTGPGTLYMAAQLPAAPLVVNGGILDLGGLTHFPTAVTFTSGLITDGALMGNSYLINGPAGVSANLQDSANSEPSSLTVNYSGSGASLLTGTNTYSGGTTISQGTLAAGPSSIGIGTITLAGGTFRPGLTPGLAVNAYTPDPGGSAFPGTSANQLLFNTQAGVAAFTSTSTHVFSGTTVGAGGVNFPDVVNGNAFASIGYSGSDNYTVVLTGNIYLPAGTSNFATDSDDGSMLFIDGTAVVNSNGYQAPTIRSGSITEATAAYHQIEIAYYQGGGGAELLASSDLTATNLLVNGIGVDQVFGFTSASYANTVAVAPGGSTLDLIGGNTYGFAGLVIGASGASTLHVTSGPAIATFAATTVANSPVFDVQGANALNLNNVSGTSGFSTTGSGIVVLTGSGSYSGPTVVNGSSLVVVGQSYTAPGPASGPLGSAPITLNNGTLVLALAATSTTPTVFDMVSGNAVTLAGSKDSIIAAADPTGTFSVSSGTIDLAGAGGPVSIASGQTLSLGMSNGYTLLIDPALQLSNSGTISAGLGNVSLSPGNLTTSAGTLSAASGGTLTMGGLVTGLAGSATYSPAAAGTVVLSGTFAGPLKNLAPLAGGTLVINDNSSSGTLNLAGGAYLATSNAAFGPATLALDGGTLAAAAPMTGVNAIGNPLVLGTSTANGGVARTLCIGGSFPLQLSSTLSLSSGTTTINDPIGLATLSGAISGAGVLALSGSPTLTNINTYSGGTKFNPGEATITSNLALGSGTITFNGGGFQGTIPLTGDNAVANPWAITSGSASGAYFGGANAIQLSGNNSMPKNASEYITVGSPNLTVTLPGLISGSGGLNLASPPSGQGGTLVISNSANTFTNGFNLQASGGTIDVQGASSTLKAGKVSSGPLGTGTITLGGNVGFLNSSPVPVTLNNALSISSGVTFQSVSGLTFDPIAPNYNISLAGAGSINLLLGPSSSVTLAGNIQATGCGINLGQGSGAGGLTLSGQNQYTGPTSITMGTLIAGAPVLSDGLYPSPFGIATSPITIGDANSAGNPAALVTGGAFEIDRPITVNATAGPTTLGGTTADAAAGGSNFSGTITLATTGNVTLSAAAGGSVAFSATNTDTGGFGTITGTGGITAASAGNGNVSIMNTTSFTGPTIISSGRLTLDYSLMTASGGTVGGMLPDSSVIRLSGGTLAFNGNPSAAVNETFLSTAVAAFGSSLVVTPNGSPTVQIALGPITRSGGVLDVPTTGVFTTTSSNTNGILGGYLTYNGYQGWASVNGSGTIGALATYNTDNYTVAGNNVDVTNGALGPQTSTTVNSLRFNAGGAGNLALGSTLTLASGGILVTPNAGNSSLGITGGSLTSVSGTTSTNSLADVVVIQGNTSAPFTISSPIVNNGSTAVALTKGGPGALMLTGPNTYTGGTTVTAGTLQFGNGTPGHDTLLAGNILNDGALVIDLNGSQTYGGTISGAGTLTKEGPNFLATGGISAAGLSVLGGTCQVNGAAAINGPATIAAGAALVMGSSSMSVGPLSGSGALDLAGTFSENATSSSEFDGPIGGYGLFSKSGTGTLILTNSGGTFSGTVRIGAGTLQLSSPLALQDATLDMEAADGGTLNTSTAALSSLTLGGLTGARNLSAPAGPLTVGGNGSSTTYSGNLSGAASLTKAGTGSLFLTGVDSFATATVSAGVLDAATTASLPGYGTAGAVSVASGAGLTVQAGIGTGGWTSSQIGSLLSSGSWASGSILGVDTTSLSLTYSGNITGGTLGLSKLGANALTLTGSVSSGPLSVSAGTVNILTAAPSIGGLAGAGSVVLGNTTGPVNTALTVNSNANSTFSGVITQAPAAVASLVKTGSGSLTLSTANTYSGGTTVQQGAIVAGNANALGSGPVVLQNGKLSLAVEGGFSGFSSMQLNGGATVANNVLTLTDGNGGEARSAFTQTAQPIGNFFTLSFVYKDVAAAAGNNADGTTFCIQNDPNGANALGATGGAFGYQGIYNSAAVDFNVYNGHVAPGTQLSYNFSGGTSNPNGGTAPLGPPYISTLPADLTSGDPILVQLVYNYNASAGTGSLSETLTDQTIPANTFSTTFALPTSLQNVLGGATGYVGFTAGTGGDASTQTISNFLFGGGANPQYANAVSVAAGASGELNLGTAYTTAAQVGNLTLNAGSTLIVTRSGSATPNSAYSITAGTTTLAGSVTINVSNNGSGLGTLSLGPLSGSGNLTLGGPGALYLSAPANGFTGTTKLNAGTLVAANGTTGSATGNGQVTLNGGVLASDPNLGGTIGGNVLAGSGANTIAPGGIGSIGTLDIGGNLTLNSRSTLDFDLSLTAAGDLLNIGGFLSVTGTANVAFSGPAAPNTTYTLATFNAASPVSLSNFNVPAGYVLQISSGELELISAPIPVPTWSALSGSWTNAANWNTGTVPNAQAAQAVVGAGTTTPVTITLDGQQTLGTLTFANPLSLSATTNCYTLAPGNSGSLVMDNTGGTAATAQIFVTGSGSYAISAPLILAGSLSVVPSAGTTLAISGNISEEYFGSGALLLDGPGTLVLSGTNSYSAGTTVTAGTLIVQSPSALLDGSNLTVGAEAASIFASATPAAVTASQGVAAVPEPGTLALLGVAGFVAAAAAWRRRRN